MKNIFAEICKVDDEKRMVYGYASTEAMDSQGEVVTKAAMAEALDDYMKFANIREMHQPSAVGVAKSAEMDEKGCFISAHVVDDSAWAKVKAGVYKGFSIGGKAIQKAEGIISALKLSEISLVDRPANPEALITVWKAESTEPTAIDQLAELLNTGAVSPEALVAFAKSQTAEPAAEDAAAQPAAEDKPADEPKADEPAAEGDAAKAEGEGDVAKGYEGEEVWDVATAIDALDRITYLLVKERNEDEQMPEQITALKAAIEALKAFIVSEIQEDNSAEAEKSEGTDDVAKAGKAISAKNMEKLQALHDSLSGMGVKCDGMGKHDHADDLQKMNDAVAKAEQLENDLAKVTAECDTLKAELTKIKAMPMHGKALLKAVTISKAEDNGGVADDTNKIAPVVDAKGETNDVASLIKAIHSKGGVVG